MKCVICTVGQTQPGTASILLERDETALVVRGIPAQVCDNCGEAYFDGETTDELLNILEEAAEAGVQVDVRKYQAA